MSVAALPHVNAAINTIVAILLVVGLVLIKRGQHETHKKVMTAALLLSGLFLASYLVYHFEHGSTKFTGVGPVRTVYFTLLLTHTVLAVVNLPFIVVTVTRAWRGEFKKHKRVARFTWYTWFYVAVTGPLVYLMLYQLYPRSALDQAFQEARRRHQDGQVDAALVEYRKLAAVGHVGAGCFAAVVGDRLEGTQKAGEALDGALEADPDNVPCLTLKGREHVYADELEEAVPVLERATELAPGDAFTHASLGFARFRKYDYEEAAAHFERATKLEPKRPIHYGNAGYAHYHYGNYPKARPLFERALAMGLDGEFGERIKEALDVIDGAKWVCPMHRHVTGAKGDDCSECGMKLTPAKLDVHVGK